MVKDNSPKKIQGTIIETLPNLLFKVKLEDGREILAHLAGKLRIHRIRVITGDLVTVELSPQEDRGRITYRG